MTGSLRGSLGYLRVRVTAAAVLAALLAGVIASVLFVVILRNSLVQSLATSASSQIDTIVARIRDGESDDRAVVSGQRDIVVQIVRDKRLAATDHANVTAPLRTTAGVSTDVTVPGLRDTYVIRARRLDQSTLVIVGLSEEQIGRATNVAATLLAVAVPLGLVGLGLVVWLSLGRALRPVEVMRTQAAEITSEHLHRRLLVPRGTGELPRLALTLNGMLDRIDASHQLQRQFVSDASHELRSPLASLRQLSEVARRNPRTIRTEDLAADVLAEEQRIEELVTAMLTLARPDDGGGAGREVDLDDIVLAYVARARENSEDGLSIEIAKVGAGRVIGDAVLLGRAVSNLLDNALRHARQHVVVELSQDSHWVTLIVADDGNGIPEEARERVFERFVRLDEARSRDRGGAGLGLAIVRKVVLGVGGTIVVDESPTGGARFVVCIPVATSELANAEVGQP